MVKVNRNENAHLRLINWQGVMRIDRKKRSESWATKGWKIWSYVSEWSDEMRASITFKARAASWACFLPSTLSGIAWSEMVCRIFLLTFAFHTDASEHRCYKMQKRKRKKNKKEKEEKKKNHQRAFFIPSDCPWRMRKIRFTPGGCFSHTTGSSLSHLSMRGCERSRKLVVHVPLRVSGGSEGFGAFAGSENAERRRQKFQKKEKKNKKNKK